VRRETIKTIFFTLCILVLNLGIYSYYARSTDPKTFGKEITIIAVATFLAVLLDFGGQASAIRSIASNSISINEWFTSVKLKVVQILSIFVLLIFPLSQIFDLLSVLKTLLLSIILFFVQLISIPKRSQGNSSFGVKIQIVERSLAIFLILTCTLLIDSRVSLSWIFVISGLSILIIINKELTRYHTKGSKWKNLNPWGGTSKLGPAYVIPQVNRIDIAVLQSLTDSSTVGQYAVALRFWSPLQIFSNSFSLNLMPIAARDEISVREIKQIRMTSLILFGSLLVIGVVFLFSDEFVYLLFGNQYDIAAGYLRIICVAMFFFTFNQPVSNFLQMKGDDGIVLAVLSFATVSQFLLLLMLADELEAMSACIGLAFRELCLFVILTPVFLKKYSKSIRKRL